MASLFPDKQQMDNDGLTSVIWEEGGEWLPYDDRYVEYVVTEPVRDLSISFVDPGTIERVAQVVETAFINGDQTVAYALDCGAGKSTRLVADLHALKQGFHTYVLLPSLVTARSLSVYCNSKGWANEYVQSLDGPLSHKRTCYYTSAAVMLDALLKGFDISKSVVVFDEAHCVTPVHRALRLALERAPCKLVMLTASVGTEVRPIKGAKSTVLKSTEPTLPTPGMSAEFAKLREQAISVGVMHEEYVLPANLLIGATFAVKTIFDTGLRPDPIVCDGKIEFGERVATSGEVVQMVGRVGRLGGGGHAYYVDNVKAMPESGLSLYTVMFKAYKSVMGMGNVSRLKAAEVLRKSGRISSRRAVPIVKSEPEPSVVKPVSVALSGTDSSDNSHTRSSSASSISSTDHFMDIVQRKSPGSVVRPASAQVKFQRLDKQATVLGGDLLNGLALADRAVTDVIRPFSRGSVAFDTGENAASAVPEIMYAVAQIVDRGGQIYPCKFDVISSNDVSSEALQEARAVLATRMLPTFSEEEMSGVLLCWDNLVASTRGPVHRSYMQQFTKYFLDYAQFVRSDPGKVVCTDYVATT